MSYKPMPITAGTRLDPVAALNDPSIVALFDVSENYFVTKLVDGESLRSVDLPALARFLSVAITRDGICYVPAKGIPGAGGYFARWHHADLGSDRHDRRRSDADAASGGLE
ncbi:MAG: hypothetical protein FJW38_07915 [Acidobacteria bacterium]|nr:hypothetical protein [Acidobacteriota bacterium]